MQAYIPFELSCVQSNLPKTADVVSNSWSCRRLLLRFRPPPRSSFADVIPPLILAHPLLVLRFPISCDGSANFNLQTFDVKAHLTNGLKHYQDSYGVIQRPVLLTSRPSSLQRTSSTCKYTMCAPCSRASTVPSVWQAQCASSRNTSWRRATASISTFQTSASRCHPWTNCPSRSP